MNIFYLIYGILLISFIPFIVPYTVAWDVGYICLMLQSAIISFVAYLQTPYINLRLKSILLTFVFFSILDVILYPLRYFMLPFLIYGIQVVVAILFLLYIENKWYRRPSVPIEDGIYLILKRVTSFKEHILSLFTSTPMAGAGIIIEDDWIHFRKKTGVVEVTPVNTFKKISDNYIILQLHNVDPTKIQHIHTLVGSSWSVFNNCLTNFYPLIKLK